MSWDSYEVQLLIRPGLELPPSELQTLQTSLREFGAQWLDPLPDYQVFSRSLSEAFDDKMLVVVRQDSKVVAFASAVVIPMARLADRIVHSGLTVVHPDHRRSNALTHLLFGNMFLALLGEFPRGVWITTLAEVISSLVQMSQYAIDIFPAPAGDVAPSVKHIHIAREISASHRGKMAISPDAEFEEQTFVFRGSNNHPKGRAFMKDVDDDRYWHRDRETSQFYRRLFRKGHGDEVLLVGFLDPDHLKEITTGERFRDDWGERFSKL